MTQTAASERYLLGRLMLLERRVEVAVQRRRLTDPAPSDAFRGLYLSDQHVDRLLAEPNASRVLPEDAESASVWGVVEDEADAAQAGGTTIRLRRLIAGFDLTELDVDLLLAALAPDLDARFEKLYGYLHDDVSRRRASVGLAIELAGRRPTDPQARARLHDDAPLRGGLLLVEDPERPYLSRQLRVPDRVAEHLLGADDPDPVLSPLTRRPPPFGAAEGRRILGAVDAGVQVVHCVQPTGLWAAAAVTAALAARGEEPVVVDLSTVPEHLLDVVVRASILNTRLTERLLVIGPVDSLSPAAFATAHLGAAPVVLFGQSRWNPGMSDAAAFEMDLHPLARHGTADVWIRAMGDAAQPGVLSGVDAYRLAPDQIERAVRAAFAATAAEGSVMSAARLAAGARQQNHGGLGRLARRVDPCAGWEELVLAPVAMSALKHLADRVGLRETVGEVWGMRRGGGRGEGITALFSGEPGTGKTLAAEVVAGELGLDLYVIDLSSVVDKYIGETEKNLERVFGQAEDLNGVLFFDEADALFGKRAEVNDARDRYANLETSYLLQRMESFDGLAILSTNFRANLDPAFTRRLSLAIEFTRPDDQERRELWGRAMARVPLAEDVDLDFCAASFDITGGDIRNISMTAAYLTAAAGATLDMGLLMRAVQVEYRKLGRLCVEAEFGPYYQLIADRT